jgi:hypothetical protein
MNSLHEEKQRAIRSFLLRSGFQFAGYSINGGACFASRCCAIFNVIVVAIEIQSLSESQRRRTL